MRAEALTAFPAWETTAPALPPRTQLYHLEPLGVGTAWTESLTSYIARLADAHCVRVSTLVAREIGPHVRERGGVQALAQHNWTHYSHALNGAAATAQVLVDVLQTLTGQPDLRFLTMLPWTGVLPSLGLLHRERAWCPACYQEWRERGQCPYEPLLWAVSAVTGCPRHGCDLCLRCPVCQQGQPPLAVAVRPGYCARCRSWLGQARSDPWGAGRVSSLSAWAQWAAEAVGELIAAAPTLTTRPTPEHLAQAIASYTAGDAQTGPLEIAHAAHMSHSHLWSWRRGRSMPTLPVLLRLCGSLGPMPLLCLSSERLFRTLREMTLSSMPNSLVARSAPGARVSQALSLAEARRDLARSRISAVASSASSARARGVRRALWTRARRTPSCGSRTKRSCRRCGSLRLLATMCLTRQCGSSARVSSMLTGIVLLCATHTLMSGKAVMTARHTSSGASSCAARWY